MHRLLQGQHLSFVLLSCCIWGLCGLEERTLLFTLMHLLVCSREPIHPAVQGYPLRTESACSLAPFAPVKSLSRAMRKHCAAQNSSLLCGVWAQLTSELHSVMWSWAFFPPPCRVLFRAGMGLGSYSVLEQKRWGDAHGEWGWPEPAYARSSQGLALVHRAEASLFLVLRGVHLMEDMLRSVSPTVYGPEKNVCAFPSLVAYTTFFHIMKYLTVANWPGSWITRQCHRAKCLPVQTAGDGTKAK